MKKIHKKRLAKLAIALLDHWDARKKILTVGRRKQLLEFSIDVFIQANGDSYSDPSSHECGTACCFLGFAPYIFPETRKMNGWGEVSLHVTGFQPSMGFEWGFLFNSNAITTPVHAAKRALFVLRGDRNDELDALHNANVLPSMSRTKLRAALQEYAN